MKTPFRSSFSLACTGRAWLPVAWAAAAVASPALAVEQVIVTGNPLARSELAQPSQVLGGDALTLRRAGTLGDTLDGLPGVSATGFGPNASRPVIRGLDGDRVRLLDNAGALVDASSLSFDHAVAIDPLVIERVEVLRGPASLLYGGSATGGVVNTLDNRIPRQRLQGVEGRAELRLGGAASERSVAGLLEGGGQSLNWHVDAFRRETSDLQVPRFTPVADGDAGEPTRRVVNSASLARGGALGASWADADGHLGLSVDDWHQRYGVVVEPDVFIRMQRQRVTLAGERRLDGLFTGVSGRYSHTRYQHQEVEGTGEVGTTFRSTGQELRLELRHAPWAEGAQGMVGLQAERLNFSALGEEAFVPGTRTESAAVFALESWRAAGLRWEGGLRLEQVKVASEGDAADATEPRFGAAQARRFNPGSLSLSALWPVAPGWTATAVLGHTQRAPAYYELYANGLHLATSAYERGDVGLREEQGTHGDLGLKWQGQDASVKLNLWQMRFSRFISLEASGADVSVEDEDGGTTQVPEYVFRSVPARLWGLELEGRQAWGRVGGWTLDGRLGVDLTRGRNTATAQALPRIAPLRVTLGVAAARGPWQLGLEMRHARAQSAVPDTDVRTPAHTRWNASAQYAVRWGGLDSLWFLKLDNLGDTLAYNATAIRTVRELSPLPGRSVSAGVRVNF